MLVYPNTDRTPTKVGIVTDQPISPDMPKPNQTLFVPPRCAFNLRSAWCRLVG